VCESWLGDNGFSNFLKDLGKKPSPKHSLDRINNEGNYEPGNCKWSTPKEQVANRRIKRIENFSIQDITKEIKRRESDEDKWDARFLFLARLVGSWSKDPSTQVGAVIVRPDKTVASVGFNGFCQKADDSPELYNDREFKLKRIIHAEINALLFCREPKDGYTLYSSQIPCSYCAIHLIQAGIRLFVFPPLPKESEARWGEDKALTLSYFAECGVDWKEISDFS
jgi:dCMP deaminase